MALAVLSGWAPAFIPGAVAQPAADSPAARAPVTLIVPSDDAGTPQRTGQIVANELARAGVAPVRIRNVPGMAGVAGTNAIAAAKADGSTLGLAFSTPMIGGKLLSRAANYNPLDDFDWLAVFGTLGNAIVVRADYPAKTFSDWLAAARASPKALRYSTGGIASTGHIAGEFLHVLQHANLLHVPLATTSQAYAALAAGEIDMLLDGVPSARTASARQFRILAVTSAKRDPLLPWVPAFGEIWPGQHFETWVGLVAPARLPAPIRAQTTAMVGVMLADPEFVSQLKDAGVAWLGLSATDAAAFMRDELVRKARQIADMGIQPAQAPATP